MRTRLAAILVSLLALASITAPAQGATADGAHKLVGLTATALHEPWRVPGDDGRDHLAYWLQLTNLMTIPVAITAVSVRDDAGHRLQLLTGAELAGRLQSLTTSALITELTPSGSGVVVMDVPLDPSRSVTGLRTSVTYAPAPGTELPPAVASIGLNWTTTSALTPISPFIAPVIEPPLSGAGWVNANQWGDPATGHSGTRMTRGATLHTNEGFAIDFIRVRDGATFTGDGTANEQYFAWGAPVLSSTDGVVVSTVDGMESIPPGALPTDLTSVEQAGGNQVVVRLAPGVFALYGHLQKGSVAVRPGDRVRVGQRLGLLGNSGNTTGAHLHFQLMSSADVFNGDSLPFALAHFTRTGVITTDADGAVTVTGPPRRFEAVYPTTLSVLALPRARAAS